MDVLTAVSAASRRGMRRREGRATVPVVAVGMPVIWHSSHRSRRAEFRRSENEKVWLCQRVLLKPKLPAAVV